MIQSSQTGTARAGDFGDAKSKISHWDGHVLFPLLRDKRVILKIPLTYFQFPLYWECCLEDTLGRRLGQASKRLDGGCDFN